MEITIKIPKSWAEFWRRHEFSLSTLVLTQVCGGLFIATPTILGYASWIAIYPWAIMTAGWAICYTIAKIIGWLYNHVKITVEES